MHIGAPPTVGGPLTIILGVLFLFFCVMGLVWGSKWLIQHAEEKSAISTFESTWIPENADVLAQQAEIEDNVTDTLVEEMVVLLEDCTSQVEQLWSLVKESDTSG